MEFELLLTLTAQILELVEVAPAIVPAAPAMSVPPALAQELVLDQMLIQWLALVRPQTPPAPLGQREKFQPLVAL